MKKYWKELRLEIHPSLAEAASNFLIEEGSPGIAQEEVKGSPGRKRERLLGYFPGNRSLGSLKKKVRDYLQAICKSHRTSFSLKHRIIREEKWAEAWKENFKPVRVSPRLTIKPPWEKCVRARGQIVLNIDPGMAFGTGTHPSTQMCLQFLEELISSRPKAPSLLDVGTGSGILAMAAIKLGARGVLAMDIDPVAIACARANARANRLRGISFRVGPFAGLKQAFDLVVANLLPQEILTMVPALSRQFTPGGLLILSGFLARQKREIAETFAEQGLQVLRARQLKGWNSIVLKRVKETLAAEGTARRIRNHDLHQRWRYDKP